jgi:hypothetical protein
MDPTEDREWTRRVAEPLRYRRYTGLNHGGIPSIFFEFDLPNGQRDVPEEIYKVIKSVKTLPRLTGDRCGMRDTGLEFRQGIWRLPDNPLGRIAADALDFRLHELAERMKHEQSNSR